MKNRGDVNYDCKQLLCMKLANIIQKSKKIQRDMQALKHFQFPEGVVNINKILNIKHTLTSSVVRL